MKQFLSIFTFLLFAFVASAAPPEPNNLQEQAEFATRSCIVNYYESQAALSIVEQTNRNDHEAIDGYFAFIGLERLNKPGTSYLARAYCGAFLANAWLRCMPRVPFIKFNARLASVDGWRYSGKAALVSKDKADKGDVVAFRAFRHVEGIIDRHPNPTFQFFTVIGANTSAPRELKEKRGGVYRKTRLWRDISHVISVEKTLQLI
jgi:hypothetical protein